jgi:transcription antitermination factor NusA-like protein
MTKTIDMQGMRYLNLFEKITGVRTRYFFKYNETLMFCVPRHALAKALGKNRENLKRMSDVLKKRVRIVVKPDRLNDIKNFFSTIVSPLQFKNIEVKENEIILNSGGMNKAAFIGRDKRRLYEMRGIVKDFFNKDFRVA